MRLAVTPAATADTWWIEVVARDRPQPLARHTAALTDNRLDIIGAITATWGDGSALASFLVQAAAPPPAAEALTAAVERAMSGPLGSEPAAGVVLTFDDAGSPWHTVCTARGGGVHRPPAARSRRRSPPPAWMSTPPGYAPMVMPPWTSSS